MKANDLYNLFAQQVAEYHKTDNVDAPQHNPYPDGTFEAVLWEKSWVDTVQWHLEDLVRPDDVDPVYALQLKRRIDRSNQHRTDLVERIDDHYYSQFKDVKPQPDARLNTETPAWAIDQLLDDLAAGRRQMKLYRQMKMYNDPSLNPSLYKKS